MTVASLQTNEGSHQRVLDDEVDRALQSLVDATRADRIKRDSSAGV
jgi:hypothetical protein